MKTINQLFIYTLFFSLLSCYAQAQNLDDAKKAIDAEQYQKAKFILKNLTQTHADKDENFFYLGWVYIEQGYADSAKTQFSKGIALNAKSALNYAGLGAVARLNNDVAGINTNFNQAIALAHKDTKPYVYVGKSYLLPLTENNKIKPDDANAAIAVLEKGKAALPKAKDANLLVTLGDAYLAELKSNDAYRNYADALTMDPKSTSANVAEGVLWRMANNWESADKQFQAALAIDPNYGPAYREWAETDYREAQNNIKVASAKIKEAVDHYKKYLSLTDMSLESQLRYADFLINAGDYKTLQQVAAQLAKYAKTNLRVYRYLGYAGYENQDYAAGLAALNKFMANAGPKRIIPTDYLYLGRLQVKTNQDSLGILNMEKAAQLDSTHADVYSEIGNLLYTKQKYAAAGDAYKKFIELSHKGRLNDYFREGMSYYYGYSDQYYKTINNKDAVKPDSTLLALADSAFSYVQQKTAAKPVADVFLYRARVNDLKDADRDNMKALAKPFYEQYIAIKSATTPADARTKKNLSEAYAYLGSYYEFKQKDETLAAENFEKAKEFNPESKEANAYFNNKNNKEVVAKGK